MKGKNSNMSGAYAHGVTDGRSKSTGGSRIKKRLPNLGTQHGDARGKAPTNADMSLTGDYYWPKASETVPER